MTIFNDASTTGWRAFYNNQKIHGWWSSSEKKMHINYLELKAIYYALRSFANLNHSSNILFE